jgi:UDP-glucose 4-epimerase
MTEELVPRPEDPYGVSKYAAELDLRAAREVFGLRFIVFRPHNVYGERQNVADRYRNVIGIFMNQVMNGQPMTVFGDGTQTRAFSHVDDVAPVIARSPLVPEAYDQVFNIGADRPYSVNELAHEVARAFGVEPCLRYLPARQEVLHAFSEHGRVARVFGSREPVGLREGITRMARWARERGPMPPCVFRDIEVRRNLPPSWDL